MIDFTKKIVNSDKFRQAAIHFQKYGYYTAAPKGTTEYIKYWEEEQKRSIEGYTAPDGDWCSGYNYFYLNYCPIQRIVETETKDKFGKTVIRKHKTREFADFYDYDYYFFCAVDEAEHENKHMVVLKSRRKGYSFKCGSMLDRNYYLIPESKSYAMAGENEFLVKDGIITKAWEYMDFIDEHTAWGKKRQVANRQMHRRASYITTDATGNKIEGGYKSEVMGVTLKNDPQKARGKAGKLILFEEAGKLPNLLTAWTIAKSSVEQDGFAYGLMIAFGTGGTVGADFDGLKELFYNCDAYGIKTFENIWEESAYGNTCGFFVPEYANLNNVLPDGTKLMDKDGNTNSKAAIEFTHNRRKPVLDNAKDKNAIDRYVAEHPLTPSEACLQVSGNIFPKKDLMTHLANIRNNKKMQGFKQVGSLDWNVGELKWTPMKMGDITKFPIGKDDDPTGAIVIWEHPVKDAPHGLYIAGCLTPGEKVLTSIGLKKVENVTLKDKLINKDGDCVKINTLLRYLKDNEDVYKVKMSNSYRTTTFTQEHPLYISKPVYNSNKTLNPDKFNFNFVRMRNVEVGDWVKYPNIYRNTNTSYYIGGTPFIADNFWWFVGLWLGDGYSNTKKKTTSIYLNEIEMHTINKLKYTIAEEFGLKYSERIRNGCTEINIYHEKLAKWLITTFGSTAKNKNIPENIRKMPNRDSAKLLLGFLDSDGSIYKSGKYYTTEFTSISLELMEAFHGIALGLGYVGNISKLRAAKKSIINNRSINQRDCFHLRFGHEDTMNLYRDLILLDKEDIKLNRIVDIYSFRTRPRNGMFLSDDMEYVYIQIKGIEQSKYTGTVYNFDCDTHTFITQYCTTHNCDPYDHDKSGTNSLGATFIYKRMQTFEDYYDLPVAEYTGRPSTAEEYYENVRKLLIYYNARLLYENERKGLFVYFTQKHSEYLLLDQPNELIRDIIGDTKVQRNKGIHMNKFIKDYMEGLIKEWLLEEYAPGKLNLTKILSEPLLEELISYNDEGNFDRAIAFGMVMLYRQQLHNIKVKEMKDGERKRRQLFETPLFMSNDMLEQQRNNYLFS